MRAYWIWLPQVEIDALEVARDAELEGRSEDVRRLVAQAPNRLAHPCLECKADVGVDCYSPASPTQWSMRRTPLMVPHHARRWREGHLDVSHEMPRHWSIAVFDGARALVGDSPVARKVVLKRYELAHTRRADCQVFYVQCDVGETELRMIVNDAYLRLYNSSSVWEWGQLRLTQGE